MFADCSMVYFDNTVLCCDLSLCNKTSDFTVMYTILQYVITVVTTVFIPTINTANWKIRAGIH